MQTPQLDEAFGFRLVNGSCTDADYSSWETNYNSTIASGPFNAHIMNGPSCLMSKEQVIRINKLVQGIDLTPDRVNAEAAFNAAGAAVPSLLLAVAAVVALVFA